MSEYVLEVAELCYSYPPAGSEPPFEVYLPRLCLRPGEICALTGVSGCGKSTLLECLGCLREDFSVEYFRLGEHQLHRLPVAKRRDLRRTELSFMPQQGGLIPFLTVRDNLMLQLELASAPRTGQDILKQRLTAGYELLESLEIADLTKRYPEELSIGQRQRAAFCKALIHHPRLVLVDEPTSALDPDKASELFSLMHRQALRYQVAMLVVTHDLRLCEEYGLRRFAYLHQEGQRPSFTERCP